MFLIIYTNEIKNDINNLEPLINPKSGPIGGKAPFVDNYSKVDDGTYFVTIYIIVYLEI